jgi:hypothetical protein
MQKISVGGITDRENGNGTDLLANVTPVRIGVDDAPSGMQISSRMTCTVVAGSGPPALSVFRLG